MGCNAQSGGRAEAAGVPVAGASNSPDNFEVTGLAPTNGDAPRIIQLVGRISW